MDEVSAKLLDEDQKRAVAFGWRKKKAAFWMDMGAGKTLATLTLMNGLVENFQVDKVLVVSTIKIVTETWPNEINKWAHLTALDYRVLRHSDRKKRKALYRNPATVHLINVEMLHDLLDYWGDKLPYQMLVLDESSLFKDRTARTRFKKLKRFVGQFDRVIELTASPASKNYIGLWSQMYLLDHGKRLGKTFSAFSGKYLNQGYMAYDLTLNKGADKQIQKQIKDLVLRIERPPAVEVQKLIKLCTLPKEAREIHDQLVKDLVVVLENGTTVGAKKDVDLEYLADDEDYVEAETAAVLTGKIRQICNGAVYVQDSDQLDKAARKTIHLHEAKIDILKSVAEEAQSNLFVVYQFKSDVEKIKKVFPAARTIHEVSDVEKEWNAGEIPLLLAHPKSASHGLNLQHGGHVVVFFGVECSGELETQIIGRLARRGQKRRVTVIYIFAEDSREKRLYDSVQDGLAGEQMLLRAMKD